MNAAQGTDGFIVGGYGCTCTPRPDQCHAVPLCPASGHKRTLEQVQIMSVLPPKADISTAHWDVRFVPKADNVRRSNLLPSLLQSNADQEADLIIRRRHRIADDLASEVQIA